MHHGLSVAPLPPPRLEKEAELSSKIMSLFDTDTALWGEEYEYLGQREKCAQYAHVEQAKCMAWVGLGPRICSGVSQRVYLQGPRSECGREKLILHQCLRVSAVPGVGIARMFTVLDPAPNIGDKGHYVALCPRYVIFIAELGTS